ncbi:hypothetical protein OIU84_020042 [Salix udensis]|uniref:DUF4283 domain-containing protein n=1 Tax=Salix udensis TaxID=889485 RepID=A0AAD6L0C8_9ROSI|nr:hypothetical protein OIU84_020042 [Salix udensis]
MKPNTLPLKKTDQPPPKNPNSSWAEKVRISDSSSRFSLDPIQRQAPGGQLHVSEDLLNHNVGHWSKCMVGFIPGFRMSYQMVNTIANRVWKQCGLEHVTTMANGFMLFQFTTEAQMQAVMEKGPWLFGGKAIILQQWHPAYRFDRNKISKLPVWIRLHGLPFPLWTRQSRASLLACFEIVSPLSSDPITIEVEYEWTPPTCPSLQALWAYTVKNLLGPRDTPNITIVENPPNGKGKDPQPSATTNLKMKQPMAVVVTHAQAQTSQTSQTHSSALNQPISQEINQPVKDLNPKPKPKSTTVPIDTQTNPVMNIAISNDEVCHLSKMDSLGSRTITTTKETQGESSASGTPIDEHDQSPLPSPKAVKKKKGGKKHKCKAVVMLRPPIKPKSFQFKFLNLWTSEGRVPSNGFSGWNIEVLGDPMMRLTTKLKSVKVALKAFHERALKPYFL